MEILNFSLLLTIFSGRRLDFNRHKILHENLETELICVLSQYSNFHSLFRRSFYDLVKNLKNLWNFTLPMIASPQ